MLTLPSFAAIEGVHLFDITDHRAFALFLLFLLGGCFGSFANAAAMRLVRDESPIAPPSRCRFCDVPLGWRENMPLIGWLFLQGRCRCKKFALPKRYVMVEWGFAVLSLLLALLLPLSLFIVFCALNIIIMIALLTDVEAMVLHPPSLLLGGLIAMLASLFAPSWPIDPLGAVIGALTGAGLIIGTNLIYQSLRGKNGFGTGDIWLLGMIGTSLGAMATLLLFFAASFIGAVAGIILISGKKAEIGSKLPFGLFLSIVFLLYPALNMLLI